MAPQPKPLLAADVPKVAALIHGDGVGWQQTEDDLRRVVDNGETLSVSDGDGTLLSMAALCRAGPNLGWLAYVATSPDARRRGHARKLVEQLLVQNRWPSTGLYGSEYAVPLYASLGFADVGEAQLVELQHVQEGTDAPMNVDDGGPIVPAADALRQLTQLDAAVYGCGRGALITQWSRQNRRVGWVMLSNDGQTAEGYVLGRPIASPAGGMWIGPCVARDACAAERLLRRAIDGAAASGSGAVQALLPSLSNPDVASATTVASSGSDSEAVALALRLGFTKLGDPARLMVRGEACALPWQHRMLPQARESRAHRPFAATGYEYS